MARQGKGIIGSPRGRVSNLIYYPGLKHGNFRSVYNVDDKYKRAIPVIKYRLALMCDQLWLTINTSTQNTWSSLQLPGEALIDTYKRSQIAVAIAHRQMDMRGTRVSNLGGRQKIFFQMKDTKNGTQYQINVPSDNVFWTHAGSPKLTVRYYKGTVKVKTDFLTIPTVDFEPIIANTSTFLYSSAVVARISLQKGSSGNIFNEIAPPFYNPDNL